MDAFRWVLLLIGAALFLLIFFVSKKKPGGRQSREHNKIEPGFRDAMRDLEDKGTNEAPFVSLTDAVDRQVSVEEEGLSLGMDQLDQDDLTDRKQPLLETDEKLIVLYLVEKHGDLLTGSDIIKSLEQAGMNYGDMKIFHYYPDNIRSSKQPVFSIANLIDPGYFEMDSITDLRTPGLSLFLKLPGPVGSISAFDQMVKVIEKLQGCLPLIVKDKSRNIVSKQMLMHLREEVVEFDRMSTIT